MKKINLIFIIFISIFGCNFEKSKLQMIKKEIDKKNTAKSYPEQGYNLSLSDKQHIYITNSNKETLYKEISKEWKNLNNTRKDKIKFPFKKDDYLSNYEKGKLEFIKAYRDGYKNPIDMLKKIFVYIDNFLKNLK